MKQKTNKKINLICDKRLEKYFSITEKAEKLAKKAINSEKKQEAKKILEMVSCYLSDAHHFQKTGNYVNAFACINYAHGWLDSGARLGIFKVTDSRLFTIE